MNPSGPSNFSPQEIKAMRLISVLCDDQLTPDQALELEDLVRGDPEVRKLYVRLMLLHGGLYQYASALGTVANAGIQRLDESPEESTQPGMNETMVLPAMSELTEDFNLEADEPQPFPTTHYATPAQPGRFLNVKTGIAAILILGLGVGMLTYFLNSPGPSIQPVGPLVPPQIAVVPPAEPPVVQHPPVVAFLDSSVNPVWATTAPLPQDGGFIAGQMLTINSGAVQLKMRNGGRGGGQVVIEGPVQIQLVSDTQIWLRYGKLAATVPGGGLVIQTISGKVTDLGTEFGVSVKDADTEVAVFKGRVSAALSSGAATQPVKELTAGQAAVMSGSNLTLNPEGAVKQRYICSLNNQAVTSLDVTDLINGGDGTTRNRGISVDSLTGFVGVQPPTAMRPGDGKYHKAQGYPVVDGAFVPDGNAPMVVDSAGDRFQFEKTTNQTYNYIWTGGHIPWTDQQGISTLIGKQDYSAPEHAIICAHCNDALTLDLNAVRRMYPDHDLAQFNCLFANSYVNGWFGAAKLNPVASAYVLIDGKSRYQKLHFTNQDGTFHVALPLLKTDRFLTLVCTDAGTEIDHDWILWADAKINLSNQK